MIKDSVREVLEKDPKERSDDDIDVLFEFMQSFSVSFNLILLLCLSFIQKNDEWKRFCFWLRLEFNNNYIHILWNKGSYNNLQRVLKLFIIKNLNKKKKIAK